MKAIILSIGNEVLTGKTINTNSAFIASELEKLGIETSKTIVVGDYEEDIATEVKNFLDSDATLLFTTGGLGPTHDDLTKEVICKELGLTLEVNEEAKNDMFNYFKEEKNDCNVKQTLFPKEAIILKNKIGSADGAILKKGNKAIVLLVGPPHELVPLFKEEVIPHLEEYQTKLLIQDFICMGNSESYFENLLYDLVQNNKYVSIAPYASNGVVRFRVMAEFKYLNEFYHAVEDFKSIMTNYIVSIDNRNVEEVLVEKLKQKNLTISFAESMTGGMLASSIVSVPGASDVLKESLVTYSEEVKTKYFGIDFSKVNVVSQTCAEEMAKGLKNITNSDVCVTVTGYAGPTGDEVGKVCYAIKSKDYLLSACAKFRGNREMIIQKATRYILYQTLIFVNEIL